MVYKATDLSGFTYSAGRGETVYAKRYSAALSDEGIIDFSDSPLRSSVAEVGLDSSIVTPQFSEDDPRRNIYEASYDVIYAGGYHNFLAKNSEGTGLAWGDYLAFYGGTVGAGPDVQNFYAYQLLSENRIENVAFYGGAGAALLENNMFVAWGSDNDQRKAIASLYTKFNIVEAGQNFERVIFDGGVPHMLELVDAPDWLEATTYDDRIEINGIAPDNLNADFSVSVRHLHETGSSEVYSFEFNVEPPDVDDSEREDVSINFRKIDTRYVGEFTDRGGPGETAFNLSNYLTLTPDGDLLGAYAADIEQEGLYSSIFGIDPRIAAFDANTFSEVFVGGHNGNAALTNTGSLLVWGYGLGDDDREAVTRLLEEVVVDVAFNYGAGAAELENGEILTWGHDGYEAAARDILLDGNDAAYGVAHGDSVFIDILDDGFGAEVVDAPNWIWADGEDLYAAIPDDDTLVGAVYEFDVNFYDERGFFAARHTYAIEVLPRVRMH